MKIWKLIVAGSFFSQVTLSQSTGDQSPLIFKVRGVKSAFSIFPDDTVIWAGKHKNIKLRTTDKKKRYILTLEGGQVRGQDSAYSLFINTGVSTVLTVYEKLPENRSRTVYSKRYHVKHIPDPVVYICGVKTDSVIDKEQLIREDLVYAHSEFHKTLVRVKSFEIIVASGDKRDTISTTGDRFNLEMRRRINNLVLGDVVYFEQIHCLLPDGTNKLLKPVMIFIDDTDKYKVGYRNTTK